MKRKTKKGCKKKTTKSISKKKQISDLELLEMLIKKIIEKLEKNSWQAKIQDILRAIQLKQKLASSSPQGPSSDHASSSLRKSQISQAEKMFWEMIDQIREEELGKLALQSREDMVKSKEP